MGNAVPEEDLLLLLCADAIVLVEEVEEGALWFFQGCVVAGLEVTEIREDALFKLFRVLHGATKSVEAESEAANNVRAGDVKKTPPEQESVSIELQ